MKTKMMLMMIAILVMAFSINASEDIYVQTEPDMQILVAEIWELSLEIAEKMPQGGSEMDLQEELNAKVDNLKEIIFTAYEEENEELLKDFFVEAYRVDPYTVTILKEEIIEPLRDLQVNADVVGVKSDVVYIPGYGYSDPDYLYKLGRELDSEHMQDFWKEERRTLEEHHKYNYYIEMSVATEMSENGSAGGNIEGFEIKGSAMFNINGEMKEYAQVEFETTEKIETVAMVMYEKRKVTFELFRAKESFWSWLFAGMDFEWEYAGTCFLFKEFPAQTDEIYPPELLAGL